MRAGRFAELQAEHDELLREIARLEGAVGSETASPPDLSAAIGAFLSFFDARLEPHLRAEATEVYPLLDRYLTTETASAAALQREQQTIRDLVVALRRLHDGVVTQEQAADEVRVVSQDLALLLGDLIRKEDRLYHPLLQRLIEGGRHV